MSRDILRTCRALLCCAAASAFLACGASAQALTPIQFAPVQELVTEKIEELEAQPQTPEVEKQLRWLERAQLILDDSFATDGKALRGLLTLLRAKTFPEFQPALDQVAANLIRSFNNNYDFIESLLEEMPPSEEAERATAQFAALAPIVQRLNAADTAAKVASLLDQARRRLSSASTAITRALIVPFPTDISTNTISFRVNGRHLRTSSNLSSENVFSAVETETNILINIVAIDGTANSGSGARRLTFSVAAQSGTFRYQLPDQASLAFSTGVYTPNEVSYVPTEGTVFIGRTQTEVFGLFVAASDEVGIAGGRFRVTLSSQM